MGTEGIAYVPSDNYLATHGLRTKKQRNEERKEFLAVARRLKALETNKVNPTVTPNAPPTLLASPDSLADPSCAAPDDFLHQMFNISSPQVSPLPPSSDHDNPTTGICREIQLFGR